MASGAPLAATRRSGGPVIARPGTSPAVAVTAGSRRSASSRHAGARCRPEGACRHRRWPIPSDRRRGGGSRARRTPAPGAALPAASTSAVPARSCSSPPAQSRRTAIRFIVKVPVLSTHKTVVAPSSSTAGMLRVSTFSRASRQAPRPRKMVSTTGNSSGRMAIANVRPASKPCSQSPRVRPHARARPAATLRPIAATQVTMRCVSRWTGVASVEMACSEAPMRPRALRSPVAVTLPCPVPWVTSVPEKAWLRDSAPASDPTACACFITGADSPVSSDSSIDEIRRLEQAKIGRHAISLGQQDGVADDQFAAGDANRPSHRASPVRADWTGRAMLPGTVRCGASERR